MSDVRLVPDEDARYETKGNAIEKGMIKFLMDNDIRGNEGGLAGHKDDCPTMLKYVNEIRPKVQILPFD